jgi:hypothetical protein
MLQISLVLNIFLENYKRIGVGPLPFCTGQKFEDKELEQDGQEDKQDEERILL